MQFQLTKNENSDIGDRKTEEIIIGGRVHVGMFGNDHADDDVADDSSDGDEDIEHRDRYYNVQGQSLHPELVLEVLLERHVGPVIVRGVHPLCPPPPHLLLKPFATAHNPRENGRAQGPSLSFCRGMRGGARTAAFVCMQSGISLAPFWVLGDCFSA
jgi:hypothetical protein